MKNIIRCMGEKEIFEFTNHQVDTLQVNTGPGSMEYRVLMGHVEVYKHLIEVLLENKGIVLKNKENDLSDNIKYN